MKITYVQFHSSPQGASELIAKQWFNTDKQSVAPFTNMG